MDWTDEGIILAIRRHGEGSAIVSLLTRGHGRHAGLVRGASGKAMRGVLQPGNQVQAHWRARLAEHLGTLSCELTRAYTAPWLHDPLRLAAVSSVCAVAEVALPEREAHAAVYEGLCVLLESLGGEAWPSVVVKWELGLLQELGFGLDLGSCAATGDTDDLAYVSPKSGRAVSRSAAAPYRDRLLPLPAFLLADGGAGDLGEVAAGLDLTGFFLERHVLAHRSYQLPDARRRLVERLAAKAAPAGDAH